MSDLGIGEDRWYMPYPSGGGPGDDRWYGYSPPATTTPVPRGGSTTTQSSTTSQPTSLPINSTGRSCPPGTVPCTAPCPPGMLCAQVINSCCPESRFPGKPGTPGAPGVPGKTPGTPPPGFTPPMSNPASTSDIDFLRTMPREYIELARQYMDIAKRAGEYLLTTPQELVSAYSRYLDFLRNQLPQITASPTYGSLQQQYGEDIAYLRQGPGEGIDQAFLTTARENINRQYDASRQRLLQEYARRGLEPSSGIVQSELRKLEEARLADLAKAERDLAMWKIGETRSRLAEARSIAAALEGLERARMGEQRAVAGMIPQAAQALETFLTGRRVQAVPLFGIPFQVTQQMDQYERSRRAEARAIETLLNELERQRIFDMLAVLSGTYPPTGPASVAGSYAGYASNLAAALSQAAGSAWSDLGALLGSIFAQQRQATPGFPTPRYTPVPAPPSPWGPYDYQP